MANKMLIDAAHPEETRVVVLRGKRVEEFDYEAASRQQLRGNIYLAKVTRVEPSLQAAFVDYGGNRHGFLAFSEIHPDYYQIPVADRQALLEEEALAAAEDADDDNEDDESNQADYQPEASDVPSEEDDSQTSNNNIALSASEGDNVITEEAPQPVAESTDTSEETSETTSETAPVVAEEPQQGSEDNSADDEEAPAAYASEEDDNDNEDDVDEDVESVGSEDALEELPQRPRRRRKVYKIQEVIRRRQVILVQVVKEERGNKGAALTTYLSLAGRHTVLMPNTARGGGISRKITNPADRKRLRKIAGELDIPEGTGLIIRTAGASRTKAEIKRDYEYLLRLWENVRDLTMESTAPAVVYEEGDLIKRSIRDLYSKEIDEVVVAGEASYKDAKSFMRMIMPSHAKNVKLYKDNEPLFIRHQIERQLNEMYSPYVTLPSGGYIVINQTEALVSIDVNSGKSTKEHSIEDTALRTNLEASEEISRQLRLRDLAGLVVIDFIDMDERRNNRAVERRLKECLKNDRARIQVGRISHFGLLEMSRQRLRTGVLEGSTTQCPHCQGTGIIRSTDSVSLSVLRAIEDTLIAGDPVDLSAITSVDVALYVLNQKRSYLKDIEARYGVNIRIIADQKLQGANFQIEVSESTQTTKGDKNVVVKMDWGFEPPETKTAKSDDEDGKRRRKRRRKRRDRNEDMSSEEALDLQDETVEDLSRDADLDGDQAGEDGENGEKRSRTRRRGRRGGRRHRSAAQRKADSENSEDSETQNDKPFDENAPQPIIVDLEPAAEGAEAASQTGAEDEQDDRDPRDRSRRRFPGGRRRTPRRRNNRRNGAANPEGEADADTVVVTAEDQSSKPEEARTEEKREDKPAPRRSSRPPRNREPKPEGMENKPAEVKTEMAKPVEAVPAKAEIVKEAPKQDNKPAPRIEQEASGPTRKGWWQKRAQ